MTTNSLRNISSSAWRHPEVSGNIALLLCDPQISFKVWVKGIFEQNCYSLASKWFLWSLFDTSSLAWHSLDLSSTTHWGWESSSQLILKYFTLLTPPQINMNLVITSMVNQTALNISQNKPVDPELSKNVSRTPPPASTHNTHIRMGPLSGTAS